MKPFSILFTLFLLVASLSVVYSQQAVRQYFSNSNSIPIDVYVQANLQAQTSLLGQVPAGVSSPIDCVPGQFYHFYGNSQLLGSYEANSVPDRVVVVPTAPAAPVQTQTGQQQGQTGQMNNSAQATQNEQLAADPKTTGTTAENILTFTFADAQGNLHTIRRDRAPNGKWSGRHPDFNEYFADKWYNRKLTGNQFVLTSVGSSKSVTFVVDLDTNVIWLKSGVILSDQEAETRLQTNNFDSYRQLTHASYIHTQP